MSIYSRFKRRRVFITPQSFLDAAIEYFQWCEDNPLQEENVNVYQGEIIRYTTDKCRAFTKKGLALYLGIPESRLAGYKSRGGDWAEMVELVEQAIYEQKFTNAAAGLLNAGIITRDLGLAEKKEVAGTAGGAPIDLTIVPIQSGTFLPPVAEDDGL